MSRRTTRWSAGPATCQSRRSRHGRKAWTRRRSIGTRAAALISAERDFIIEVVGQALGEFRSELLDEIDKMIAEEVEKPRTEAKKTARAATEKSCCCRTRCGSEPGADSGLTQDN